MPNKHRSHRSASRKPSTARHRSTSQALIRRVEPSHSLFAADVVIGVPPSPVQESPLEPEQLVSSPRPKEELKSAMKKPIERPPRCLHTASQFEAEQDTDEQTTKKNVKFDVSHIFFRQFVWIYGK